MATDNKGKGTPSAFQFTDENLNDNSAVFSTTASGFQPTRDSV